MARQVRQTFDCPNCGAEVPVGALACPECGADDDTGWSEDTAYDGLDLPEPGDGGEGWDDPAANRSWKTATYALAAAILLVAFLWALSRGGRLW